MQERANPALTLTRLRLRESARFLQEMVLVYNSFGAKSASRLRPR